MPQYYTQYWKTNWLSDESLKREEPLTHVAGNLFRKKGVQLGDFIYIVTLDNGQMYLIGRLKVGKICSQKEANEILGNNLWVANEHLIAERGTEISMRSNALVPLEITKKLKFITSSGEVGLAFETENKLDKQTLRGVRKLSSQSAMELDRFLKREENVIEEIEQFRQTNPNIEKTSFETIIQSRIGQGQFRTSLIKYWKACSVSGCQEIELLKASHIKPWRFSSNTERLDLFNGLLLLPNLDTCFDAGWISFRDDGHVLISSRLDELTLRQIGISPNMKLLRIDKRHLRYLKYHRENVFRW